MGCLVFPCRYRNLVYQNTCRCGLFGISLQLWKPYLPKHMLVWAVWYLPADIETCSVRCHRSDRKLPSKTMYVMPHGVICAGPNNPFDDELKGIRRYCVNGQCMVSVVLVGEQR